LIAHTQKLSKDSSNWNKLDSLRTERRLIVLAVTSLEYHKQMNANLCLENQTLKTINLHNESYIGQLQADLSHLKQVNEVEIGRKKKWRKATLYSLSFNAIFLGSLYVLSR
jgi:hypothetical protein